MEVLSRQNDAAAALELAVSGPLNPAVKAAAEKLDWSFSDVRITDYATGKTVFEQKGVLFPSFWSDQARTIVASKYFLGPVGTAEREWKLTQMVGRVVGAIGEAYRQRTGVAEEEAFALELDLAEMLLRQRASFNSPVWFNVGSPYLEGKAPQCSACFILQVDDTMESILDWIKNEGLIFKNGSGSGVNLSRLRSSYEKLSNGGRPSGPISFMRTADVNASSIKSGGKTRRAAKMVILNADHLDVEDFIELKVEEERKVQALLAAGWSPAFDGKGSAYAEVFFQNANNSVRVTDEFMRAVEKDEDFWLKDRKGNPVRKVRARELFRKMADAAWKCGDPGIQFHDTINRWNPVVSFAEIEASNPCSEYMFLNNTSCNLASLNLLSYSGPVGFDVKKFQQDVRTMIRAMDVIIDISGYPTPEIDAGSRTWRTLGLGYTNLGALLMVHGIPYDSEEGRLLAGAVTALMHLTAWDESVRMAREFGPCAGYAEEGVPEGFQKVLAQHWKACEELEALVKASISGGRNPDVARILQSVSELGQTRMQSQMSNYGIRNAQVTVLAPTGTISFMMDAATTGIEPELALVKYKSLAGGGTMKLVNPLVREALHNLYYTPEQIESIVRHIEDTGTIEGAPHLDPVHLPVFDCSFKAPGGKRSLSPQAHIRMMAAVQPFLSGAISKTVNLPEDATAEDIEKTYLQAWRLGLKAVAVYRDNCKKSQPLSTKSESGKNEAAPGPGVADAAAAYGIRDYQPGVINSSSSAPQATQRKLEDTRPALVHEFRINGSKGFLTVGLYPDGQPAEIFIDISKEGSTISGLMDTIAILTSFALQYGVPLEKLASKFRNMRFEPSGFTGNQDIPYAHSVVDYVFNWLQKRFGKIQPDERQLKLRPDAVYDLVRDLAGSAQHVDGVPCRECGALTIQAGSCHVCPQCGTTTGCG